MGYLKMRTTLPKQTGGPMGGRRRPDFDELDEQLTNHLVGNTPEAELEAERLDATFNSIRDLAETERFLGQQAYLQACKTWDRKLDELKAELMWLDDLDEQEASDRAIAEMCDSIPCVEAYGAY
jgi:hypothetical protein